MSPTLNIEVISRNQVPLDGSISSKDGRGPVILVVDDERIIADTLSIILTTRGFSVVTAYNAEAALELTECVPPELLLSDVMMGPGMDGTELALEVVSTFPGCKVMLFSGHSATRDLLERTRELGHNFTLLTKPLHPSELLAHIAESFAAAPSHA